MLFKEFKLKEEILQSLEEAKYIEPSPIQEKVMNLALAWKSIVWQAQTWTGKTAAFLLPLLNNIDRKNLKTQALILAPTRELVVQICEEIDKLTKHYLVSYVAVYWWVSSLKQKKALRQNPMIIVATPWRFMDLLQQRFIQLSGIQSFILDEVDRMLDMWFVRDITKIWTQLKSLKQTFTFSATMNDKMKAIINQHIKEYEFIKVWKEITVDKINHSYSFINNRDKFINLVNLVNSHKKDKILVFVNTKRAGKIIYEQLSKEWYRDIQNNWYNVWILHWDIAQSRRLSTLQWYTKWKYRVLVTTDVAARWLNLNNVWFVINFDAPIESENYIHRIWRTWRAGEFGKAIMFIWENDHKSLKEISIECWWKIKESEYQPILDKSWTFGKLKISSSKYTWWRKFWIKSKNWWNNNRSSNKNFNQKSNNNSKNNRFWNKPWTGRFWKRYNQNK